MSKLDNIQIINICHSVLNKTNTSNELELLSKVYNSQLLPIKLNNLVKRCLGIKVNNITIIHNKYNPREIFKDCEQNITAYPIIKKINWVDNSINFDNLTIKELSLVC